jgi:hypothetical protein
MTTVDVLRSAKGELTVILTGPATAPTVVDQGSGVSVMLEPAVLDSTAMSITVVSALGRPGNAWFGTLPIAPGATEARLEIDVDGHRRQCVARWPTVEQMPSVH